MFNFHTKFIITKKFIFTHNLNNISVCEYLSYSTSPSLPLREYYVGVCLLYGLLDKPIYVFTLYSLKGLWGE